MKIGIIGTGAFAIAIASLLENKNFNIMMWTKLHDEYEDLIKNHKNSKIINYQLDKKINFTMSLETLLKENEIIILALPTKFVNDTIQAMKPYYKNQPIIIATKGIEEKSELLLHEYLEKELETKNFICLSGPTFAIDIIQKEPIALTIASKSENLLLIAKKIFADIDYLTVETTNDIIGCELCGILKNIIAIASGILAGMNITCSTNAKFLVDISHEIQKIIEDFKGNKHTFYSYAGLGDLILTCTSKKSRNYTFGFLIGSNQDFKTYQKQTTIEGLENLNIIVKKKKKKKIKSTIIDILYEIVYLSKPKEILVDYLKMKK